MVLASKRNIKWGKSAFEGQGNPNFTGGQYVDEKGYMRVLRPKHPAENHGYVYMHRLVMEDYLGRYLKPWEVIHHINEIKLDNRIENLYLCTSPEHSRIHSEGKVKSLEYKTHMRKQTRKNSKGKEKDAQGKFVKKEK